MTTQDLGKLVLRLAIGGLLIMHGISKLIHGIGMIATSVEAHGLPSVLQYGVYVGEVLGPALVILGLWARVGGAFIAINMAVALYLMHVNDFGHLNGGGGWAPELPVLFLLGGLSIALLGAGRFSVSRGAGRFN